MARYSVPRSGHDAALRTAPTQGRKLAALSRGPRQRAGLRALSGLSRRLGAGREAEDGWRVDAGGGSCARPNPRTLGSQLAVQSASEAGPIAGLRCGRASGAASPGSWSLTARAVGSDSTIHGGVSDGETAHPPDGLMSGAWASMALAAPRCRDPTTADLEKLRPTAGNVLIVEYYDADRRKIAAQPILRPSVANHPAVCGSNWLAGRRSICGGSAPVRMSGRWSMASSQAHAGSSQNSAWPRSCAAGRLCSAAPSPISRTNRRRARAASS